METPDSRSHSSDGKSGSGKLSEAKSGTNYGHGTWQLSRLSAREYQILALACHDYSNAQIAARLFLNENLVQRSLQSIADKMGLSEYEALIQYARKYGFCAGADENKSEVA